MSNRFVEIIYIGRNLFLKESHPLLFLMLSNISQALRVTQQGIRNYEMQDPGYVCKQFLNIKHGSMKELFLISKRFLGQSGYAGVRKLSPRDEMKMADQPKESVLSKQIICNTKHFSYNIPRKHLINSILAYGQPIDITPLCCLAVKLSLSAVKAVMVHAGSCTFTI